MNYGGPTGNSVRMVQDNGLVCSFGCFQNSYKKRYFHKALQTVEIMEQKGLHISAGIFSSLLQGCINRADLAAGRQAHRIILQIGLESSTYLGSYLIRLFAACGCLLEANQIFKKISKPNVFAWSAIIAAHSNLGQGEQAIKLYHGMQQSSMKPDSHVFVAALNACASINSLKHGQIIHNDIIESGHPLDGFIGSSVIDMHAKCGSIEDAHRVFDRLQRRDVVTWGILIAGYVQHCQGEEALRLVRKMQQCGIEPDRVTFLCILKACTSVDFLDQGMLIHCHIIENGYETDMSIGNTLIDMYAKCGNLEDARRVLDKLPKRDVVTWSAIITGYTENGIGQEALQLFKRMQNEHVESDRVVLASVLKACSNASALDQGKLIHNCIIESMFEKDVMVGSAVIDMYAKCGSLEDACKVFQRLPHQNLVTWNTIISGCAEHGLWQDAVLLVQKMLKLGFKPNQVTFVCILKACSGWTDLHQGRMIHDYTIVSGLELDILVGNTLIDMYCKCGSLDDAERLFYKLPNRDVVTWSITIAGLVEYGCCQSALQLFQQMQLEGMEPDDATCISILKACSALADLNVCMLIHSWITNIGIETDVCIGNTLIDMYAKCGNLENARMVFEKLQERDVVTYNAMIAACTSYGQGQEPFQLYQQMQLGGTEPNQVTFVSILKACCSIAALDQGQLIHGHIIESDLEPDVHVGNTLIDMYAKCGNLKAALQVFHRWQKKDVVTWNAIIAGCAQHSNYELALQYFEEMHQAGLNPDGTTFVSLLSVCSHAGLVNEGRRLFLSMKENYDMIPKIDHYNCMVDLLGRAGCLNEAEDFLQSAPFGTDLVGWTSLLSHCKMDGNVKLGQRCFDHFVKMDDDNAAGYVLMSHVYSHAGMEDDAGRVEETRKCANAWKKPGKAAVEIENGVHDFIAGSKSYPQIDGVNAKFKRLSFEIKCQGYFPCLDLVLSTMPDRLPTTSMH